MNEAKIKALDQAVSAEDGSITGMVVLHNGQRVYEGYFNGFTQRDAIHVFSVTKSVVSTLIGIALGRGLIQSVEQRVLDFFPDYTLKRGEKILPKATLENLLTMTAPYKYKHAPYTRYFTSEDWVAASLDLLGGKGTLGEFRYAPLIGPDILTGILQKATGRSPLAFANEALFSPLGIKAAERITFQGKDDQMAWYAQPKHANGWVADPQGVNTAGWGLCLTPMDMAKLGQLYLNGGLWENRQIVPAAWIAESTREHSRWNELAYGYLWWVIDPKEGSYAALGDGGNAIYVNPEKSLTVVVAARFKPRAKDRVDWIRRVVEPALD